MTTMDHTVSGTVGRVTIGRRISELMQERGDAFSIRAFAQRLDLNRETFRLILTGERPITLSTLEKVAQQLGITEERLRQKDSVKKEDELNAILEAGHRTKTMLLHANKIAIELVEVSLGFTERGMALNNLGKVQYLQRLYDEAHQTWLKSIEYAYVVKDKFEDIRLFQLVSTNLMLTYVMRREFSDAEKLLMEIETQLATDQEALGFVAYTRMNIANARGLVSEAKDYAYQSLEFFEQLGNTRQIRLSLINVAHFESASKNYKASVEMLSKAMQISESKDHHFMTAVKEYVKALIQLGELQYAVKMIEEYENDFAENPVIFGKMMVLKTVSTADPSYADSLVKDVHVTPELKYFACMSLFELFVRKGEAVKAIEYYELSLLYNKSEQSVIEKGGF